MVEVKIKNQWYIIAFQNILFTYLSFVHQLTHIKNLFLSLMQKDSQKN
jgi:hypothetical protein